MEVMSELKPIGDLFRAGELSQATSDLHKLWEKIPEPKTSTLNSYLVIEYGVAVALRAGDLEDAQNWADLAPDFACVRQDMGEVELLIGKVAFERGDIEAARSNFATANLKSEGRAFQGANAKYKKLIE